MYEIIKDAIKGTVKIGKFCIRVIGGIIIKYFGSNTTSIFGPSKSGKTTLLKILRKENYFIGEYNHTSNIITYKKGQIIEYVFDDKKYAPANLKIKRDVAGEDLSAWSEVLIRDRPKAILYIVDLSGLVSKSGIDVQSNEEFIDFEGTASDGTSMINKTTARKKFALQAAGLELIAKTCREKGICVKGMMVLMNKCDLWLREGVDLVDITYEYKKALNQVVNLTEVAKSLNMSGDILWEATSMVKDYKTRWFEPAILKFSSFLEEESA